MKREFIKGLLGEAATKEIIDSILDENGKDIETEKSKAKEIQMELDKANATIKTHEQQLEQLMNSPDNPETLKNTIAQLQADNAEAKKQHEAEMKQLKVDNALEKALTGAGARNALAVKALLKDLDKAELLDDGSIKGLADQLKELKKSDSYLFAAESTKKNLAGTKPAESNPNGGGEPSAKKDSEKSYEDFVAELNNNAE